MSKKKHRKSPPAAAPVSAAPAATPPPAPAPAASIPWFWLALAVAAGGLVGWAAANANSFRSSAPPAAPPSAPAAVAKPPAATPPVPGLTAAQSNAIFKMTNQVAAAPAAGPTPPALLSAAPQPPVAPVVPQQPAGETLYNGIVLPAVWPPKGEYQPGEPMPVPYLSNPPPVIDITLGRQLFVDNFLIESNTTKRTWHSATLYSNNPVLKPDAAWETAGNAPMAMPFSDGVWMDPVNLVTPPAFQPTEIQDVAGLVEKLKTPGTNALLQHLSAQLAADTRAKLAAFNATNAALHEPMRATFTSELNKLIAGPLLHTPERFNGVRLQDRTVLLLARAPKGGAVERLTRWLLEDAFPRELFRMQSVFAAWYMAGYARGTALALSTNGLDWEKPKFDVQAGSNLVQTDPRDSSTVWLDQNDMDASRRYKMWRSHGQNRDFGLTLHFSPDGIHWGAPALRTGAVGDRSTVFFNPFRNVWVYSLRDKWGEPRARRYWEVKDLIAGPHWKDITEPTMWVGADHLDPMRADLQVAPQLYNLDATPYESLMVGLFTMWRGDKNMPAGRPKPNSIWLGFSRDGYHWDRPDRRPLIDVSEKQGDWNWGNVQSAGGGFLVYGRNLWFYFSGRGGAPDKRDAGGAMGLAFLRRDGFCSMDAGPEGAVLTTRPVKFNARFMFVNMQTNAPDGSLRIEILHPDGRPITVTKNDTKEQMTPFTADKSNPMTADQTLMGVSWQNGIQDLSMLSGRTVRIRFHLKNASLYSFWVGPGQLGRSMGYVAAGGPHFTGPTDAVGNRSYSAFPAAPRTVPPPAATPATATAAPVPVLNAGDNPAPAPAPPKK